MARKKSSKPASPKEGETLMFPSLHQTIVKAVSDDNITTWFQENDSDEGSTNAYTTHVMGRFKCNNNACSQDGWSSKKVAISIRGYPRNGYNAVVFNQRCMACKRLGTLTLDIESYVDRVAYRLKKWAGVAMEQQYYAPKEGPPHERDLCEGCQSGSRPMIEDIQHVAVDVNGGNTACAAPVPTDHYHQVICAKSAADHLELKQALFRFVLIDLARDVALSFG
ncbi:hypothetical protein MMC13_001246 [Lambiella insularis]|nr:hypothetical protein [Lambiella insularis]